MSTKKKATKEVTYGRFVVIDVSSCVDAKIPRENNPTVVHSNLESAKEEAARLASAFVGRNFAVFKCVEIACAKPVAYWKTSEFFDVIDSQLSSDF